MTNYFKLKDKYRLIICTDPDENEGWATLRVSHQDVGKLEFTLLRPGEFSDRFSKSQSDGAIVFLDYAKKHNLDKLIQETGLLMIDSACVDKTHRGLNLGSLAINRIMDHVSRTERIWLTVLEPAPIESKTPYLEAVERLASYYLRTLPVSRFKQFICSHFKNGSWQPFKAE